MVRRAIRTRREEVVRCAVKPGHYYLEIVDSSHSQAEEHRYIVNGRTPLKWYINQYRIKRDKESGIVNDPNGWFEDPRDLVAAIERIVYVSVESTRIIEGLPTELTDGSPG